MMRDPIFIISAVLMAFIAALVVAALYLGNAKPEAHAQLRNPYYPFSVETSIRDR